MWSQWPARKLVEIEINRVRFYLDLRLWECRSVKDFSKKFSLDRVIMMKDHIRLCWDPRTKNVFQGNQDELHQRQHEMRWYQLPTIDQLDPIGYRAHLGYAPMTQKEMEIEQKYQAAKPEVSRKAVLVPEKGSRKNKGQKL
jgi:hypothetical protein